MKCNYRASLVQGGSGRISIQQARDIVSASLRELKKSNVRTPTNIPWDPKK